jgi:hypothetical protein
MLFEWAAFGSLSGGLGVSLGEGAAVSGVLGSSGEETGFGSSLQEVHRKNAPKRIRGAFWKKCFLRDFMNPFWTACLRL